LGSGLPGPLQDGAVDVLLALRERSGLCPAQRNVGGEVFEKFPDVQVSHLAQGRTIQTSVFRV